MNISEQLDNALNHQTLHSNDFGSLSESNHENIKRMRETEQALVLMLDNVRSSIQKAQILQQAYTDYCEAIDKYSASQVVTANPNAINPDIHKAIQSSNIGANYPNAVGQSLVSQKP